MRCHYCNYNIRIPSRCADCSGEVLRFSGFGTQKLEAEIRRLYPEANVTRIDRDTTRGQSAFETMHRQISSGKVDILIGTQMITKGHHFPNVTLVGVIYADLSLNIPDFRSCERSFQLLTQVSGRAGRGKVPGQVIIQTCNPNHYVFDFVKEHDFDQFSRKELTLHKKLNYPPFTRLIGLEVESQSEREGTAWVGKIKTAFSRLLPKHPAIEILGPSRAALYQINNRFRWHFILRSRESKSLRSFLHQSQTLQELRPPKSGKTRLTIDVDPVNLL